MEALPGDWRTDMTGRVFAIAAALAAGILLTCGRAQLPNDHCSGAPFVAGQNIFGTNVGATTSLPSGNCGLMGNEVWYRWIAPCTGFANASTCIAATFDTVVAAWDGTGDCCGRTLVGCNDDSCGFRSLVAFPVIQGTTYFVSVGGYAGATGTFTLDISCFQAPASVPINDHRANAIPLPLNTPMGWTNVSASTGGGGGSGDPVSSGCPAMAEDVWFTITPPALADYEITTCFPGTNFDTVISIWTQLPVMPFPMFEIACNDDNCGIGGQRSTITTSLGPSTFWLSIGGYGGANGRFVVRFAPANLMNLYFPDNGPGTLGFAISAGPPAGGSYLATFTTNQGAFPNGWFLGLDIPLQELIAQLNAGPPFVGPLAVGPCGGAMMAGPFTGLPSGLTIYAVAAGFPPFSSVPTRYSLPQLISVP
jgi:hypothetical protein